MMVATSSMIMTMIMGITMMTMLKLTGKKKKRGKGN